MTEPTTIAPTDWHRRPAQFGNGPCPVCSFPFHNGIHRAVAPQEGLTARWIKRWKTRKGWKQRAIGGEPPPPAKRPKPPRAHIIRPHRPTPRVAKLMGQAAALVVHGKTIEEAAEALNVRADQVWGWKHVWKDIWQMLVDRTAEGLISSVRAMVGTNEILNDPKGYVSVAGYVDDWATAKGIKLFAPVNGDMTLGRFFEEWYLPQKLFDATENTKSAYRGAVKAWRLVTGDPPVQQITPLMLALFRQVRLKMPGIKPGTLASPNTVRSLLRMIQTLLDKLGPPGHDNRDALGILDKVPWVQPPRAEERIPRTVTLEQISTCYQALATMRIRTPRIEGLKPQAWWQALIAVTWNTGLRRGTLFAMRWTDVDWDRQRLVLPAGRMKSRRPMVVHLNAAALEALRSIHGDRELVFPWFPSRRCFHQRFHEIQNAAGIPREQHFGLHMIRKTLATTLWETNPGAAQFALGHATADVTQKHYVDGRAMVARALEALPQPAAFTRNGTSPEA